MKQLSLAALLIFSVFIFTYKLDYEYFFTDEATYNESGMLHLKGQYAKLPEVPLLGKYIAGITGVMMGRNLFLLRLPYALMGVASVFLVYLILEKEHGHYWGLLGGMLFTQSPFLYSATRRVMLEPVLHLIWLSFHLMYLRFLETEKPKYALLSGLFIGLGMATKIPSTLLYPFSFTTLLLYQKLAGEKIFDTMKTRNLLKAYTLSVGVYVLSYAHFFSKEGVGGLIRVAHSTVDNYIILRDLKGKTHLVGSQIFTKSPWWYYLFHIREKYAPGHLILTATGLFAALTKRTFFTLYWLIFFSFILVFFQLLHVKAERYISSFELPLIFLATIGMKQMYDFGKKYLKRYTVIVLAAVVLVTVLLPRFTYLLNVKLTKYNALYFFLDKNTNHFTDGNRTIIYGSVRSGRWRFADLPNKPVITRKDFDLKTDYPEYKYIVFDRDELAKSKTNLLYDFVMINRKYYDYADVADLDVYIRKDGMMPKDVYNST